MPGTCFRGQVGQGFAVQFNAAACRLPKPCQGVQQCGLAGSIAAEDAPAFTFINTQIQALANPCITNGDGKCLGFQYGHLVFVAVQCAAVMQQRQEQGHADQCREDANRQLAGCQQCAGQGVCNNEQATPEQYCRR